MRPPRRTRAEGAADRIRKHNRLTLEALADRAELAARLLAATPPWPRRRWRVEGSRAGNSGLTTRPAAERLRARLGGALVEVVPSETAHKRAAKAAAGPA